MKLDYLEPILNGRGLYFPKVSSFNDPFDAFIFPRFEAHKSQYLSFYNEMLKSSLLNRAERRRRIKKNRPRIDQSLMETAHTKTLQEVRQQIGVLCLAESRSDILMWSHYAAGHSGVCIGFDTSDPFFQSARKVVYQKDYPDLSFDWFSKNLTASTGINGDGKKSAGHEQIDRLFLTKAEQWKYEAEWRISRRFPRALNNDENGAYFSFPHQSVINVAVGANASTSDVATVRNWLDNSLCRPHLFRVRVSTTKFALEFDQLD